MRVMRGLTVVLAATVPSNAPTPRASDTAQYPQAEQSGFGGPDRASSSSVKRVALGFVVGVVCTAAATQLETRANANRPGAFDREDFHAALGDVLDRYVEPVDESRLLSQGLKHIVAELDAHSHYLTAQERRDLQKRVRGGSAGLSAVLRPDPRGRRLEIVSVDPGSSAERAGLRPGDFILAVGARVTEAFTHQAEVETMLRGPIGDHVQLTVQRRAQAASAAIDLAYAHHEVDPVTSRLVGDGDQKVALVRIRNFRAGTGASVRRALEDARLAAPTLRGIVLDLRDNPGGEVDEALIVADLFVSRGALTRTRGRGGRILREEFAHEAGTDTSTRLVVLQNRHSASAAELLSAALQDHGRARIAGERSFGKGTVQQIIGMEDGSVLSLTIARYFSPQDRVIEGVGVNPDVDLTFEDEAEDLRTALALL